MADEFGVIDRNVQPGKTRTHTFTGDDGRPVDYTFKHNVQTMVPAHHAAKFQAGSSFVVYRRDGTTLPTLKTQHPLQSGPHDPKLEPGQTIAMWEELTREALVTRAYQLPGGSKFKANAKRDDVIAFLTGNTPSGGGDQSEIADDEMSAAELDAALPKQMGAQVFGDEA